MKQSSKILSKIFTIDQLSHQLKIWQFLSKKIVFTNGVFDIVHKGHLTLLFESALYGDILIVGVNSDESVRRLKGETRPVIDQGSRALLLASLVVVDAVIIFEEDTPLELIKKINPDVLVKGGDYTVEKIVGAAEVISNGGEVKIISIQEGFSTTAIIEKTRSF